MFLSFSDVIVCSCMILLCNCIVVSLVCHGGPLGWFVISHDAVVKIVHVCAAHLQEFLGCPGIQLLGRTANAALSFTR